jgi:glutamyl-tRNA reductase
LFLIEYKLGERELLEYLKSNNFDKQFEKLTKKLQNKTIIIYGAGKMFQEIQKNYDLSKLNIVGVMDRKYLPEDTDDLAFGYNIIPYSQINDIKSDVILISAQKYQSILNMFKKLYHIRNSKTYNH